MGRAEPLAGRSTLGVWDPRTKAGESWLCKHHALSSAPTSASVLFEFPCMAFHRPAGPAWLPASSSPSHSWSLLSPGADPSSPLDPRELGNKWYPPPAFLNSSARHLGSPLTQPENVQLLATPRPHLHACSNGSSSELVAGLLLSAGVQAGADLPAARGKFRAGGSRVNPHLIQAHDSNTAGFQHDGGLQKDLEVSPRGQQERTQ